MPMHWQVNRPRWRRKCPQQLEQHNRGLSQSKENRLHTSTRLTSSSTYSASSTAIAATDGMADILSIATLRCSFSNSGCACGSSDSYSMASEASSSSSEAWGRECKQRHASHCLNTVAADADDAKKNQKNVGSDTKRKARSVKRGAHGVSRPPHTPCTSPQATPSAASSRLLPQLRRSCPRPPRQTWTAG